MRVQGLGFMVQGSGGLFDGVEFMVQGLELRRDLVLVSEVSSLTEAVVDALLLLCLFLLHLPFRV